jgi:hypothetical protein
VFSQQTTLSLWPGPTQPGTDVNLEILHTHNFESESSYSSSSVFLQFFLRMIGHGGFTRESDVVIMNLVDKRSNERNKLQLLTTPSLSHRRAVVIFAFSRPCIAQLGPKCPKVTNNRGLDVTTPSPSHRRAYSDDYYYSAVCADPLRSCPYTPSGCKSGDIKRTINIILKKLLRVRVVVEQERASHWQMSMKPATNPSCVRR